MVMHAIGQERKGNERTGMADLCSSTRSHSSSATYKQQHGGQQLHLRHGPGRLTWSSKAFCLALCASTSLAICRKYSVRLPEASARAVACASK